MTAHQAAYLALGDRVGLRAVVEGDVPLLAPWLPQAIAAAQGRKTPTAHHEARADGLLSGSEGPAMAVVARADSQPIGVLSYRRSEPEAGWVTISLIAIEPTQRIRGLGGEAVLAFEEFAARGGWGDRFSAPIHPENGLVVYFWLRLGYRPAGPTELPDGIVTAPALWMVRVNQ